MFLLAHHTRGRYARTFRWSRKGRTYHVCARCAGQAAGLVALVVLVLLEEHFRAPLFSWTWQAPFALAPLPAAWDWTTQALGRRESTNILRLVSGALLGAAWGDAGVLLTSLHWLLLLGALTTVLTYLVGIVATLHWRGALPRVVDEHFPRSQAPGP